MVSDSQTSQDSSGSQIEEPTGPGATSKFLQKWQIDFEPLFTPFLSIAHQNQPHSDLRHTLKYRFLKFRLKLLNPAMFSVGQSDAVFIPPLELHWDSRIAPRGSNIGPCVPKSVPGVFKIGPRGVLGDSWRASRGLQGLWKTPRALQGGSRSTILINFGIILTFQK